MDNHPAKGFGDACFDTVALLHAPQPERKMSFDCLPTDITKELFLTTAANRMGLQLLEMKSAEFFFFI